MYRIQRAAFLVVVIAVTAGDVQAGMITLNATDAGWYNAAGQHFSWNPNYIAGLGSIDHRNFFTFDLSSVSEPIVGATLRLENPVNGLLGDPAVYSLFDVTTPAATLNTDHAEGPAGRAIFTDLGDGNSYGSIAVDSSSNGSVLEISLNAQAISALNSAAGGNFAVGGTLSMYAGRNVLFASSNAGLLKELVLETSSVSPVPEPSSFALLSIGAAMTGLGAARRRRREKLQPSDESPREA